ncbi:MAG: HAMP domain-containing histidine kinase [Bacteroidetes bacterium]|nr:HAMP domain-containing histidine kinase [Bacteroidota bacterium]
MLGKICIIVTDITELKNHQQNLQQLVNERTSELERTNFELKEINATKDKLFSIITHDLRGPFTSLMGYSDLAIENIETFDKEKFEKILFHINSAARSAYTLLENLLIWARSKNGQLLFYPRELPLSEVVDGIIENLNSLAHIKNIRIINLCDKNIVAYGDENMFNAIIRNLLTNAIKFCNKNGKIEISAIHNQKFVEVRVKDNGIGMSEEIKNNLFLNNKGVTLTGTAHEKGTGLGLLICSEFVEKHNGRIWAESDMGNGSCFYFTLPNKEFSEEVIYE